MTERRQSSWPLLLAAALVLCILVGGLAWYNVATYRDAESWVRHTYEVIARTDRVMTGIARAEAAARAMLIVSDSGFQARFEAAAAETREAGQELRALTADNLRQQQRMREFGPLLERRIGQLEHLIETRAKPDSNDVAGTAADPLRQLLRAVRTEEESLLRQRSAETDRHATQAVIVIGAGTAALFALLSLAIVVRLREQRHREQAERELLASESRLRQLVEDVTEYAIVALDEEGRIRTWNAGAERINGYPGTQALGLSFRLLYTPEDRSAGMPEQHLETARRDGSCQNQGWRLRADATRFWAEVTLTALRDARGVVYGYSCITRDLTEAHKAYRELGESEARYRALAATLERRVAKRTRELEAANAELTAFSYSVSHDLRAPLRAVEGFGRVLVEDYPEGTAMDAEAIRLIGRMRAATVRMGQLIQDLLELSRVSRVAMERLDVDVSDLAGGVAQELQSDDPERRADWQIHPGLRAEADPKLVRIVLENLLGNAWKFTSGRERTCIEVGRTETDRGNAFYVRDNGAGFNPEFAGKLFQPFQRLHRESEFPGTGIGLATVARIVHRHGGEIWGESQPGQGAAFYFTLGDNKRA